MTEISQRPVFLAECTYAEVKEALETGEPVAILPIGATETHGPHLPLQTDLLLSTETAHRAALRLREAGIEAFVLPTLPYTVCQMGYGFAGTINIASETVTAFVRDILVSLVRHGFKYICVNNAHLEPASVAAWKRACQEAKEETGAYIVYLDQREPRWADRMTEEFNAGDRHAGRYETGMVMAVWPHLVREGIRQALPPVKIDLPGAQARGARSFEAAGAPQGYFGEPAKATADEGEDAFETLAEMLEITIKEMIGAS
ncbi:MAG: creatininase family protein [Dehalococcoidia bacterium]